DGDLDQADDQVPIILVDIVETVLEGFVRLEEATGVELARAGEQYGSGAAHRIGSTGFAEPSPRQPAMSAPSRPSPASGGGKLNRRVDLPSPACGGGLGRGLAYAIGRSR